LNNSASRAEHRWVSADFCPNRVTVTRREKFEYGFQAPRHLLIAYERGEQEAGETLIEGLPRSTMRKFNCRLSLVPAGRKFYGWQTPRVLTRVTYFYIDLQDRLFESLVLRHVKLDADHIAVHHGEQHGRAGLGQAAIIDIALRETCRD
jgi:hypothetical protein